MNHRLVPTALLFSLIFGLGFSQHRLQTWVFEEEIFENVGRLRAGTWDVHVFQFSKSPFPNFSGLPVFRWSMVSFPYRLKQSFIGKCSGNNPGPMCSWDFRGRDPFGAVHRTVPEAVAFYARRHIRWGCRSQRRIFAPGGGWRNGGSKVVSTHLWNTPLNLYQQARKGFLS